MDRLLKRRSAIQPGMAQKLKELPAQNAPTFVRLDHITKRRLAQVTGRFGLSQSAFIRMAIISLIETYEATAPENRRHYNGL